MRSIFNKTLVELAQTDQRIWMVLADIGYGEIETFAEKYPERYLNVGVAEQNMTGAACGLAMEGKIAITYSIANFPTLRCLEQIRNDVCYHRVNVKIVIIGGGVSYGPLGISHHAIEDIAIMRALPNMVVVAPCDNQEAIAATKAMIDYDGPFYYRCGYKNEADIHPGAIQYTLGKSNCVQDGKDIAIIFTGPIGYNAFLAAQQLQREGISVRLISMHTVKPIDQEEILSVARNIGRIITLEEHNICGGLGSAVAEVLADNNCLCKFRRIAFPDVSIQLVGSQNWLREQYGMSPGSIAQSARELLN